MLFDGVVLKLLPVMVMAAPAVPFTDEVEVIVGTALLT